jgi:hypothetical protein
MGPHRFALIPSASSGQALRCAQDDRQKIAEDLVSDAIVAAHH